MSESRVYQAQGDDPEMLRAYANARANFHYFWREVAWDRNRIVPALGLAAVKAPFSDGDKAPRGTKHPAVEHMWLSEVDFDGRFVSGLLANDPNWLKSVKAGDEVRIPLDQISDWMYAISGIAYGAYTVNLLRSRMSLKERKEHDKMWGLDFGDAAKIRVVSEQESYQLSEDYAKSLAEDLAKDPSLVSRKGHRGWTLLHQQASAGSVATVKVLLKAGADASAVTDEGFTALQLAQVLGWDEVAALLARG